MTRKWLRRRLVKRRKRSPAINYTYEIGGKEMGNKPKLKVIINKTYKEGLLT